MHCSNGKQFLVFFPLILAEILWILGFLFKEKKIKNIFLNPTILRQTRISGRVFAITWSVKAVVVFVETTGRGCGGRCPPLSTELIRADQFLVIGRALTVTLLCFTVVLVRTAFDRIVFGFADNSRKCFVIKITDRIGIGLCLDVRQSAFNCWQWMSDYWLTDHWLCFGHWLTPKKSQRGSAFHFLRAQ